MTFGTAIELLKDGKMVARKGWNGKGMYLFLLRGGLSGTEVSKQHPYIEEKTAIQDCICMFTAQKTICVGWLASQADMLSDDWTELDG